MANIEALTANSTERSDWNLAWSAVSPRAAGRDAARHKSTWPGLFTPTATRTAGGAATHTATAAASASDELARHIADIERAVAVLRHAAPALELRVPSTSAVEQPSAARSVWPMVGAIWLVAATVVSCAIGAVVLFLS